MDCCVSIKVIRKKISKYGWLIYLLLVLAPVYGICNGAPAFLYLLTVLTLSSVLPLDQSPFRHIWMAQTTISFLKDFLSPSEHFLSPSELSDIFDFEYNPCDIYYIGMAFPIRTFLVPIRTYWHIWFWI